MANPSKAVFLSYTSQDADAARRLSEALQAVGLEVWFDKDELRGGDAWDASIRKQIKECALFVPVVSENSNARIEGYFRLEWKLAVDRSHQMAEDAPFLMPVALDGCQESTARVPDRFRDVQWSRPFGPETVKSFAERALRLLSGSAARTPSPAARPAASPDEGPSIAVLPFVNMSRDEENEYFADGLSEELLNVLAKISGLRVASRTSAFFFKGKTIDIPTVAQKLNVGTILEGSVRKSGKRVRITAQLIDVAKDSHLWSQTYDRELDDIFAVQDDIAQSVVTELRAALPGVAKEEIKAAAAGRADDPEAHRLHLQGRFFLERMTQADAARSIELFRQAVSLDPDFALGWVGLSRGYSIQAGYGWAPVESGYEAARDAARRALAINPDLADAHVALAHVMQSRDWDWKGAIAVLEKAIKLAPNSADALRAYGGLIGNLGRKEECLELLRKAAALDPLSSPTLRFLGLRYFIYGHFDEAEEVLRRVLDLNPNSGLVHCFLGVTRLFKGDPAGALDLAAKEALPDFRLIGIVLAQHALGHAAEADRALDQLDAEFGDTAAYQIAECCAWRGETERAFEWLERAYRQRDPGLSHLVTDPFFTPLHGDARWIPLARKMGLT